MGLLRKAKLALAPTFPAACLLIARLDMSIYLATFVCLAQGCSWPGKQENSTSAGSTIRHAVGSIQPALRVHAHQGKARRKRQASVQTCYCSSTLGLQPCDASLHTVGLQKLFREPSSSADMSAYVSLRNGTCSCRAPAEVLALRVMWMAAHSLAGSSARCRRMYVLLPVPEQHKCLVSALCSMDVLARSYTSVPSMCSLPRTAAMLAMT